MKLLQLALVFAQILKAITESVPNTSEHSKQIKNIFERNIFLSSSYLSLMINETSETVVFHESRIKRDDPIMKYVTAAKLNNSKPAISHNHWQVNAVFENSHKLNKVRVNRSSIVLTILGLFELSDKNMPRREGVSELKAAQMAIKHINRMRLIPGYMLELLTNDTKNDPGIGIDRFFHALYTHTTKRIMFVLGTASSEVTENLARVVPYWNIVQVSFGSTSPALSDRNKFPLFHRTIAPDSSLNPARIAFIRQFKWDAVAIYSENEEINSLFINNLVKELEKANISCKATVSFSAINYKEQLRNLKQFDTRIVIASFSNDMAPRIFCEAYKLNMFGVEYVWILQEDNKPSLWIQHTDECDLQQVVTAIEGIIIVANYNSMVGNVFSDSGMTNPMFEYALSSHNYRQVSQYARHTYDAMWSLGLVLSRAAAKWRKLKSRNAPALEHFDYTRYDMAKEFLHQFSELNFQGVSGPILFTGADRIGLSAFYQIQRGQMRQIALYHPEHQKLDFNCPDCVYPRWYNEGIPFARRILKMRIVTISSLAFGIISLVALMGILVAITYLAFNTRFKKLKTVKLSSPKLSNVTAIGCVLVYAAVIILGLDDATLPSSESSYSVVCITRIYLLSAGFSLTFGSMFAKTYRVHKIFTHGGGIICRDKMLQDTQLIGLVCILLLIDGLVVTIWISTDPIERQLKNLSLELNVADRSVVYQTQVEICESHNKMLWLSVLYTYKGLLLLLGVYMAWETRQIKIPALNDSQYIGVTVYCVVITSLIVVTLTNLLTERITLVYIIKSLLMLTSTTGTLCLLFLPKVNEIWIRGNIDDPIIHSLGLKMEFNTRRFAVDERKELLYRVDVQNRVYHQEIMNLDKEICKLEKHFEHRLSLKTY